MQEESVLAIRPAVLRSSGRSKLLCAGLEITLATEKTQVSLDLSDFPVEAPTSLLQTAPLCHTKQKEWPVSLQVRKQLCQGFWRLLDATPKKCRPRANRQMRFSHGALFDLCAGTPQTAALEVGWASHGEGHKAAPSPRWLGRRQSTSRAPSWCAAPAKRQQLGPTNHGE